MVTICLYVKKAKSFPPLIKILRTMINMEKRKVSVFYRRKQPSKMKMISILRAVIFYFFGSQ